MTINKTIKNTIDTLEVWDEVLNYKVTEVDTENWFYFTLEEIDWFETKLVDDGELFDMIYEGIQEDKANS